MRRCGPRTENGQRQLDRQHQHPVDSLAHLRDAIRARHRRQHTRTRARWLSWRRLEAADVRYGRATRASARRRGASSWACPATVTEATCSTTRRSCVNRRQRYLAHTRGVSYPWKAAEKSSDGARAAPAAPAAVEPSRGSGSGSEAEASRVALPKASF